MIIVIGDLHFGIRRNNKIFQDILLKELDGVLSLVSKKDSVVILGDIFDSRSSVDFKVLNDSWDFFIQLSRTCKEVYILIGNHDLYYRENKSEYVNCRFLRFDPGADNKIAPVHIISEITEATIQGQQCLFIPWVDDQDMKNRAIDAMIGKHDIIFGHFEVISLYGHTAVDERTMFEDEDFPDDTTILSGHYHRQSQKGKIKYVGALVNSTFNDVGDIKGIHKIAKNGSIKFIEGTSPKFEYITIDNPTAFMTAVEKAGDETLANLKERIEGNIIKLIMNEYSNDNEGVFQFIKKMGPLELTVSYNRVSFDDTENGEEFAGFDAKSDIEAIITAYIDKVKEKLPEGIGSDEIKLLVNKMHQDFKMDQAV